MRKSVVNEIECFDDGRKMLIEAERRNSSNTGNKPHQSDDNWEGGQGKSESASKR